MEQTIRTSRPSFFVSIFRAVTTPLRAFGRLIVDVGERSPVMMALNQLQATSDEELRAGGLTRDTEMRRILGARYL